MSLFIPEPYGAGALCGRGSWTIIRRWFGGSHPYVDPCYLRQHPLEWQSVSFFLAGWGGLEFVGRLYEVAQGA